MPGMIALLPADPSLLTVDVDAAEPADQIHVTLAYLGDDVTEIAEPAQRALAALVAAVAATATGPLAAAVVGHATFSPSGPGQCAVHVIGDSDLLGPVHDIVTAAVATILGNTFPRQHAPWIPHATAAYGASAADLTYAGPVLLDRIVLALDDDWTAFHLGDPAVGAAEHVPTPRAVVETDDPTDDLSDDDAAVAAATAQLAVRTQRDRTHDAAAAALLVLLAAFAKDGVDGQALLDVIDPTAPRAARRAAVAAEIARQARISGHDLAWHTVARDAHTAAVLAGTTAAAHVASAGAIPIDPADSSDYPDPFDPAPWVAQQQLGLAGDIVDAAAAALAAAPDDEPDDEPDEEPLGALLTADVTGGLTAGETLDLIGFGAGALYYLDIQMSGAYLDAQVAFYLDLGVVDTWWVCADGQACPICQGYESGSPYTASEVPGAPHGGCRCFVTVAGP